jgi:hypothetical protein
MPFDGGVYTGLSSNTFNDASPGTIIDPFDWNLLFTDIEDAINDVATGAATGTLASVATLLYNHEHFR